MTWDNGDRTVLVNPNLGGMTLGWNLQHTAQDELFAAIEGTAFHTRVILDRMSEHGAPTRRVINGGGIPQNNAVLNQVYANVLRRPVLVPSSKVTGLGSAIFAFMAAGVFSSIDEAQQRVCPSHTIYEPQPEAESAYRELYELYRKVYFEFGSPQSQSGFGHLLPTLMRIARPSVTLLLLLNESAPPRVRAGILLDLVVLETGDGSIHFEHGQRGLIDGVDSVLAQSALQFIHADVFLRHVGLDGLPVVNQQGGLALDQAAETAVGPGKLGNEVVEDEQGASRNGAARQRGIGPGHCVLYGVGEQEQQRKVERGHLSDLTLAA